MQHSHEPLLGGEWWMVVGRWVPQASLDSKLEGGRCSLQPKRKQPQELELEGGGVTEVLSALSALTGHHLLAYYPAIYCLCLYKGPLKKKKKKQGGVGRLFLRGIAFFWPIL
jgi:hypothetical protein